MSGGFQYIEGRYTTRGTQKSTEKPRHNVFLRMRPGGICSRGPARRGSRGGHSLHVSPPRQTGLPHERREKISTDTQHDNTPTHSSSTEQHGIPAQQTDTRPSLHREAGPFGVLRPPAARRTAVPCPGVCSHLPAVLSSGMGRVGHSKHDLHLDSSIQFQRDADTRVARHGRLASFRSFFQHRPRSRGNVGPSPCCVLCSPPNPSQTS